MSDPEIFPNPAKMEEQISSNFILNFAFSHIRREGILRMPCPPPTYHTPHTHLIDLQTGRVTFVTVRHERIADGQPPVCLCVCVCEEGGNRVSPSTFNAPPLATTSPLTLPPTHHYPTPPHPTPTTSLRYLTSPLRHDPTTPNSVKANLVPVWAPGD